MKATRVSMCLAVLATVLLCVDAGADSRRYTVDPGVRLGPAMERELASIAQEFQARTNRQLHVTSGTRTPQEQARAMYDKLRAGRRLTRLYRDFESAQAIQVVYRRTRRRGRSRCVTEMARVIENQVASGTYISRHLRASAVDIRSRNMTRRQRRIFRRIIERRSNVTLLEEGTPPHFHLQLR